MNAALQKNPIAQKHYIIDSITKLA